MTRQTSSTTNITQSSSKNRITLFLSDYHALDELKDELKVKFNKCVSHKKREKLVHLVDLLIHILNSIDVKKDP